MSSRYSNRSQWLVYFIQCGAYGPIKIGVTTGNPYCRLALLQTGCPERLDLLGVIFPCDPTKEGELHAQFAHLRIRGEWFAPAPELLKFIDCCIGPYVESSIELVKPVEPPKIEPEHKPEPKPATPPPFRSAKGYRPKTPTNPYKLRVIAELHRAGWSKEDMAEGLGISISTLKRRFVEIRQIQPFKARA